MPGDRFAIAILSGILLATMPAPPRSEAGYPSDFRRHQEQYWVWYAPSIRLLRQVQSTITQRNL